MTPLPNEREPLRSIRRLLLAIVLLGIAGMGTELLLIGHVEDALQLVPVSLLAAGVPVLGWLAAAPGRASIRAAQALMLAYVVSGLVGVGLHYRGNAEFELEMYPQMTGMELVRHTLTGATPVLAPGSMALLGLVGLVLTVQHPALAGSRPGHRMKEVSS